MGRQARHPGTGSDSGLITKLGLALLVASAVPFGVLAYNSGYGYDAKEYIVVGRALTDGYPMFHFMPSKSFGIYALIGALHLIGIEMGLPELAATIAGIYLLVVVATYIVVRARFGSEVGLFSAGFAALCMAFMEMNFYEPETFVYFFGLGGFYFATRAFEDALPRNLFLSGFVLSLGFHFKSVAAFYGVGLSFWLLIELWRADRLREGLIKGVPALVAGAALSLGLPLIYFTITGEAAEFWKWTVSWVLFEYRSDTIFLNKLWTKLLWFPVLLTFAISVSLSPRMRQRIYGDRDVTLTLSLGLFSMLALTKTQASHYYFPGATFLCIFSVVILSRAASEWTWIRAGGWRVVAMGAAAFALLLTSVVLYKPDALARLVTLTPNDDESLRTYIRQRVPEDRYALMFKNSMYLYWVSHRYPNVPLIHMDIRSTDYLLNDHPTALIEALDDPSLVLVEYNHAKPGIQDPAFLNHPELVESMGVFYQILQQRFEPEASTPTGYQFWIRKPGPSGATGPG